jgi:P-type Cu+ transporter
MLSAETDTLPKEPLASKPACFHCGEPCTEEALQADDKDFCCTGCHTVYRILQESGLDDFYQISEKPGFPLSAKEKADFSWLDDPETRDRLVLFRQNGTARVMFQLPQIHCASCVWLLEKLFHLHKGILQSRVNFNRRELSVVYREEELSLRELVELLDKIGYRPAIQLADIDGGETRAVNRRLIYQLGVAGFAFGNIMLFSFPEYLGLDAVSESQFAKYFGYLNFALALPVFFFSATDYYRSAWAGIRVREINMDVPISLGIVALFGQSAFDVLSQTGPGYFDSLAGLLFFMLTGKWFQQKSFDRLSFERDYRSYFPVSATMEDGSACSLHKLHPGHRIVVRNQEIIPADGVLLDGDARIDYSFVTGESAPIKVGAGEKIYAGGRQTGARILVQLTHSIKQSYLTQLWNEQTFQEQDKGRASRIARTMGTHFTWVILSIAFATLFYWWPVDSGKAIYAFTSVLIIACPCAIALAIPFIMGNGVRILGRDKAYVRHPQVIENLAATRELVLDKTGTLTYADQSDIRWEGAALTEEERRSVAALARQSTHPLSRNLSRMLGETPRALAVEEFEEIPGQGLRARLRGEVWRLGRLGHGPSGDGVTRVEVERDGRFLGMYLLRPRYREGLAEVMQALPADLERHLVSGDQPVDTAFLGDLVSGPDHLHFRQQPADKLNYVRSLQEKGQRVVMIGDGLNDAGALRQSDVGVVITESLNNFTPSSDMILSADRFTRLPSIFKLSRRLVRHVFIAYGLALMYNTVGLSFAVQGLLSPIIAAILMPASSITIVIYAWAASWGEAARLGFPLNDQDHPNG